MTSKPETNVRSRITARRTSTLTSIVRDAVEDMIVRGELAGGDRINESALAEQLSVSRGPIREACRSLEQAGLVTNVANYGAYVRELSLEEARDLYEVRAALASFAARLVVARGAEAALEDLARQVNEMDDIVARNDVDSYYGRNIAFHRSFMEAAGNAALLATYSSTVKQLHLVRRRGLVDPGRLAESNSEHRMIVEAAQARDADGCAAAVRDHIDAGWRSFSALF